MNKEAAKFILTHFCSSLGISENNCSASLADMIVAVTTPYLLMTECLDQMDQENPDNGLAIKMVDRIHETVKGMFALLCLPAP